MWVRIDDDIIDHPDLIACHGDAVKLWIFCLAWANKHRSDGHIPPYVPARLLGDPALAEQCVAELLLHRRLTADGDGWTLRNYTRYQRSAEQIIRGRADAAQRKAAQRDRDTLTALAATSIAAIGTHPFAGAGRHCADPRCELPAANAVHRLPQHR